MGCLTHCRARLPIRDPTLKITNDEIAAIWAGTHFYSWILDALTPDIQQDTLNPSIDKDIIATGTGTESMPTHVMFDPPPATHPVSPQLIGMFEGQAIPGA
ncbi:MAG: hypothetical protein PHE55_06305 [Methylococcaceae bacterium]|nr:hypothetical protein [Methylococcaceae bacterium]